MYISIFGTEDSSETLFILEKSVNIVSNLESDTVHSGKTVQSEEWKLKSYIQY